MAPIDSGEKLTPPSGLTRQRGGPGCAENARKMIIYDVGAAMVLAASCQGWGVERQCFLCVGIPSLWLTVVASIVVSGLRRLVAVSRL
eukprot:5087442-Pyramimonas_sp.AAC.1